MAEQEKSPFFLCLTRTTEGNWRPSINGNPIVGVASLEVICGPEQGSCVHLSFDPRFVFFDTEKPPLTQLDA